MAEFEHGCVVDAGSSGSRIFLYRWPKEVGQGSMMEVFSEETAPGISEQERGLAAMQVLIAAAKSTLLQNGVDFHDVPIYLGATAGLRLVEPVERELTMMRIRSFLHQSGFIFQDNWARVITGEEEGVYGWLTINYMMNGGALPILSSPTYGALDLGGASTQISFSSEERQARRYLRREPVFPISIDDSKYLLYSHSFLHHGVDEARSKYAKHIIAANGSTDHNPCYPVGYVDEVTTLPGSSDWDECLRTVSLLFEATSCMEEEPCFDSSSLSQQLATYKQKFVATSAFVFAWDFLGLRTGPHTDDLSTLNKQAKEICNLDFSHQMRHYQQYKRSRSGSSIRRTSKPYAQCFNAAYSYHLLSKGYSMPVVSTPIEVHDIKSWTLGMMLIEATNLTKDTSNGDMYSSLLRSYKYVIAGSTLGLMLLASFILTSFKKRRGRRKVSSPFLNKS